MSLYAKVINLPYTDSSMSGENQLLEPLLINVPSFEFSSTNFVDNHLYLSDFTRSDIEAKQDFVANLDGCTSLWTTLDMIKRNSNFPEECTIFTHFLNDWGDLVHSGPWPLDVGDYIHVLPPLNIKQLIDRTNTHVSNYKLHRSDSKVYSHPMIISETMFKEFYREVVATKIYGGQSTNKLKQFQGKRRHGPESALGRILGSDIMENIQWSIQKFTNPVALVVSKTCGSEYDKQISAGDSMTVKWLNR